MEEADAVPDIGGMLTQRLGPLPLWAWGGAAIGGGYLLYRSGLLSNITGGGGTTTSTTAAQQAQTAAGQATSSEAAAQQAAAAATGQSAGAQLSQSIGLLQQLQQFQQQSYQGELQQIGQTQQAAGALATTPATMCIRSANPNASSAPGLPGRLDYPGIPGVYMHSQPDANSTPIGFAPFNSCGWSVDQTAQGYGGAEGPSIGWSHVSNGALVGWIDSGSLVNNPQQSSTGGGRGGPKRSTVGTAHPVWRPGHPLLGGPRAGAAGADITYPHYAVGGPRDVRHIAAQVGVHPARILALNGRAQRGSVGRGQPLRVA